MRNSPKFQVESLDVNDVTAMASALSKSARWQDRQLGVLIVTDFLTIALRRAAACIPSGPSCVQVES